MSKQLATKYQHTEVEANKYQKWVNEGYFTAGDLSKKPYSIVIPPPNVTGRLHLGHAMDNTLQDIMARYKRLQGFDVLYLPGMDHAGIATQAKIDEKLKQQGVSRYDLGREKFLNVAWEWKEEYAKIIRSQWERLGVSVDYSRERFTLDEGLNHAVNEVFVSLYEEGLIYQGRRIINWDPVAKTALSNIEVIHKEVEGKFYTFNYEVVETKERLSVATTRPETMFGDVCLVVHPEDPRYQHLIGKHAINPANQAVLPIIADDYIDIEFGTGVMKCTPAHDPNDFTIGEKYGLEKPICMNPDGTMNELCGPYEGMDRFVCREALVKQIEADGNLVSIEKHVHQVGHSERTDAIVEPYLSKQWFVKMQPLAQDVLDAQQGDQPIHFYPNRFEKTFTTWLNNIEDWCISRQLWWGHRIPAWFHKETQEIYVGLEAPVDIENWEQDEDVLDTWFSSALWPFSTLGWPDESDDLARYYPTSFLSTGYDIIFFWVARMAFQARHFTKAVPFNDCLIHGLIRDESGRKMSKSLGNGIDPMEIINAYGVDALRFFLVSNSAPGLDFRFSTTKVEASWNFINKIWNASRFVLLNFETDDEVKSLEEVELGLTDQWILEQMNQTITEVQENFEKYEFGQIASTLQKFIWDGFCSWYIELSKTSLQSENQEAKAATLATLVHVLRNIVILLHPFMPFVTEEIYQSLPHTADSISLAIWPTLYPIENSQLHEVTLMISVIEAARKARVDYGLKPSLVLSVVTKNEQDQRMEWTPLVASMLEKFGRVELQDQITEEVLNKPILRGSIDFVADQLVDKQALQEKLVKEKIRLEQEIKRSEGMLSNERFTSKAPAEKVQEEQAKCDEYKRQYQLVLAQLDKA